MTSSEHYLQTHLENIAGEVVKDKRHITFIPNTQTIISHNTFTKRFAKPPIMETFYRRMRKEQHILMEGDKPIGGEWNYDKENRKFDKTHTKTRHITFTHSYIEEACKHFGIPDVDSAAYIYPITRSQALEAIQYFIDHHLDNFGKLEDAMYTSDIFVHHSKISTAINFGILHPLEVIEAIEKTTTAINNKE
jgi:deoxyribodipyrimidine photolyase-related protein